ncbi:ribonuclease H-like domain-containing protein [Tanacetum coccineum]
MALSEDHLAKFHKMTDAKNMWEAIKSRFGEGLCIKAMTDSSALLSQYEISRALNHYWNDANQKFLRSLPSAWSQVSLIMRTKPGIDTLSFDDLYNNRRVFESDVKGSTASSSSPKQSGICDDEAKTTMLSWLTAVQAQTLEELFVSKGEGALKNKGIVDSGCSRHMTRNKAYLAEYQDYNGGPVVFGGSKGYITDTECLVLSPDFKLPDENQVLLRVPRQNNMYSFNLENIVPSGGLACLIAKVTVDKSNKWHRRLGHVNFKNLNKLVKGNWL